MRKLFTMLAVGVTTFAVGHATSPAQTIRVEPDGAPPRLLDRSVIEGTMLAPAGLGSAPNRLVRWDDDELIPLDETPAPPASAAPQVPTPSVAPHGASTGGFGLPGCDAFGWSDLGLGGCESFLSGYGNGCGTGCRYWTDNIVLFSGIDAWKNRADDDGQNNFGLRNGINVGLPVGVAPNIGFQVGGAWGVYDLQGREFGNTVPAEHHLFGTAGFYKRSDVCCGDRISWGVVWDYLNANNFGQNGNQTLDLHQLRAQLGYAVTHRDEVGLRAMWGMNTDTISAGGPVFLVDVVDQYDAYWKHVWQTGATTEFYAGGPGGQTNLGEIVLGFNGQVPLNDYVSMYGAAHLIPGHESGNPPGVEKRFAEDLWNVSAGFEFSLGGKARAANVSGNRWMPLMPVAGFGTMSFQTPANTDL
ncbi:MAG TPA: hypothetical protein PLI18_12775 [Pirellulaceae bacterium]|nr:hypothetical protein [Pirellulaceae bacterium]